MTSLNQFISPIDQIKFAEDISENNTYIRTPRSDSHKLEKLNNFSMSITQSSSETDKHGVFTVFCIVILYRFIKSLAATKDLLGLYLDGTPNSEHCIEMYFH